MPRSLLPEVHASAEVVGEANRFLVEVAPWTIAKDPSRRHELADVLYEALESLRIVALLAAPVMPEAAQRLWGQLGIDEPLLAQRVPEAATWGRLEPGTVTRKGDPLGPVLRTAVAQLYANGTMASILRKWGMSAFALSG